MLVIAPDPTTRRCPKHRGELITDSIPCAICEGARMGNELIAGILHDLETHVALRDAFQQIMEAHCG